MLDHSPSELHSLKKLMNLSLKKTSTSSIRISLCKCSNLFIILLLQFFILHLIFCRPPQKSSSLQHVVHENPSKSTSLQHVVHENPSKSTSLQQLAHENPSKSTPLQQLAHENPSKSTHLQQVVHEKITPSVPETCENGRVYVYDLPPMYNKDLLDNCRDLDPWHSRCKPLLRNGLGPRAGGLSVVPKHLSQSWYWTDMFAGEVTYHARMLKHKCRTMEPESATAFYIPFYAGLAVGKYLFTSYSAKDRDRHCEGLLKWISDQPSWKRSNGSDHFIMLGRMTWDFRRTKDHDWGSSFIHMPLMKEVLRLGVERDPWDQLEVSVPYPTGFHPKSKLEIDQWMDFVRSRNRTSLFTFVGGKRKVKGDFRTILHNHCRNESKHCRNVDCSGTKCYDGTSEILQSFLSSDFCLQPRGDAYTRRSTFDCMLAGSIPVFFWNRSIDHQYEWFLGDEPKKFSVFIDRKDVRSGTSIRKVLEGYSREEVRRMREKVISLIPNFVYGLMNGDEVGYTKDAFDLAIDGVLRRFKEQKGMKSVQSFRNIEIN